MTTESRPEQVGPFGVLLTADNSASLAQGVPAVTNEDSRTATIRSLITGLELTKSELAVLHSTLSRKEKGRGQNPRKIELSKQQDAQFGDLLLVATEAETLPIQGVNFTLARDSSSDKERLVLGVSLADESHSYLIPVARLGRDEEIQRVIQNAYDKTETKSYPWDLNNIVEDGTDEERAAFILSTVEYLDLIKAKLYQKGNTDQIREALIAVRDKLLIGRFIYMDLINRTPEHLGYNISVEASEGDEKPGLRVLVVIPQTEVDRRKRNLRSYRVKLRTQGRESRLNDIITRTKNVIYQDYELPGTKQFPETP